MLGFLAYIFTLVTTFALVSGLPVVLLSLLIERRRTRANARAILITLLVAAGFLTGGLLAWWLRPFPWDMPLWETAYASVNSEKYGHPLEHQAERILLYVLFFGDLGAIAAGVAGAMWVKFTPRTVR